MNTVQLPNDILLGSAGRFLDEGREVVLRAKGNSMLPYIRDGRDSVVLKKSDSYGVGDIVLVQLPGRFIMHRIIKAECGSFTMMGDGNIRGTESFTAEDILGKVIWIVKDDGRRVAPGKGRVWRRLLPLRRYILGIYRRIARI